MIGDQRYQVAKWVFGDSTKELIHKARVEGLGPEWSTMYDAALVIGRPVGGKGRLIPLWHVGEQHKNFRVPMACKVTFTRKPIPNKYAPLPIDDSDDLTLF